MYGGFDKGIGVKVRVRDVFQKWGEVGVWKWEV